MTRAALLTALLAAGCSADGPPRGTVRGRVTVGEKPLAGAVVRFDNPETGVSVVAPLDAGGNYDARTYQGGLPVGRYRVAVTPGGVMTPEQAADPLKADAKGPAARPSVGFAAKYHDPATSGLSVEVRAGGNPPFDLRLDR
jgi:hypothetical protein